MKTATGTIARGNAIVRVRRKPPPVTVVLPLVKGRVPADIVRPQGARQIAAAQDVHPAAAGDLARARKADGNRAEAEEGRAEGAGADDRARSAVCSPKPDPPAGGSAGVARRPGRGIG